MSLPAEPAMAPLWSRSGVGWPVGWREAKSAAPPINRRRRPVPPARSSSGGRHRRLRLRYLHRSGLAVFQRSRKIACVGAASRSAAAERGRIAVCVSVGLSNNELRASYLVGYYLQRHGYQIIPVNPREPEILGQTATPACSTCPHPSTSSTSS